jgi:hypothetical protein
MASPHMNGASLERETRSFRTGQEQGSGRLADDEPSGVRNFHSTALPLIATTRATRLLALSIMSRHHP